VSEKRINMQALYVASNRAGTGKTAVGVSLARKLSQEGKKVAMFKPFHMADQGGEQDQDGQILRQAATAQGTGGAQWPVTLSSVGEIQGPTIELAVDAFKEAGAGGDVTVVEGISGLEDLQGSASQQLAQALGASVVVVLGYHPGLDIWEALQAKRLFGDRLVGVIVNGVTQYKVREVTENLVPMIEAEGVIVLATIPEDGRLLGVSVGQIAEHLDGSFLNSEEKRDGFVEHLLIGGMMLDWGVLYFERFSNKAVVVRGDRPDIQMAALATPTSCIVLTGGHAPIQYVLYEAGEEGVPLIQVETDTLSTAAALESLMKKALFDHSVKREHFLELMSRHGKWDGLYLSLNI
jgi:BioD-like phosphotransacetylase family protein